MLARGVLCRVAAGVPKTSTHDLPQLARLLQRTLLARNARNARTLPALSALARACNAVLADSRRSYATTARATKPTATVKKAVKKTAARKTTTRKTTAKKAAPKKKAAAKKPTKKVTAKKAKPKKKPAAKPKPRRRQRKQLTPEEQRKKLIAELRKKALKGPQPTRPVNAYNVVVSEVMKGSPAGSTGGLKEAADKVKSFTPAEKEHYNHLANEHTAANAKAYTDWVHSHTPDEIRLANNARSRLRKLLEGTQKKRPAHTAPIKDDRAVKQPAKAYVRFSQERFASGDMKGLPIVECTKLITDEWKALSAGEKKKYQDAFANERDAYIANYTETYGHTPSSAKA